MEGLSEASRRVPGGLERLGQRLPVFAVLATFVEADLAKAALEIPDPRAVRPATPERVQSRKYQGMDPCQGMIWRCWLLLRRNSRRNDVMTSHARHEGVPRRRADRLLAVRVVERHALCGKLREVGSLHAHFVPIERHPGTEVYERIQ
eukprot:SAG31_NODE_906_length_11091_cov_22.589065_7_plen_148_part_00